MAAADLTRRAATCRPRSQRGVTMLMVLVLLSVMLLGGLALARITEISTLATGNSAYREASLQASEVGVNTAYAAVRGLTNASEGSDAGGWYWATMQAVDAAGIPQIDWDNAAEVVVGSYTVRYAVERMCTVATITDPLRECLVRQATPDPNQPVSRKAGGEALEVANSRQFRITVRVMGPKDTQTWVQALITRG